MRERRSSRPSSREYEVVVTLKLPKELLKAIKADDEETEKISVKTDLEKGLVTIKAKGDVKALLTVRNTVDEMLEQLKAAVEVINLTESLTGAKHE